MILTVITKPVINANIKVKQHICGILYNILSVQLSIPTMVCTVQKPLLSSSHRAIVEPPTVSKAICLIRHPINGVMWWSALINIAFCSSGSQLPAENSIVANGNQNELAINLPNYRLLSELNSFWLVHRKTGARLLVCHDHWKIKMATTWNGTSVMANAEGSLWGHHIAPHYMFRLMENVGEHWSSHSKIVGKFMYSPIRGNLCDVFTMLFGQCGSSHCSETI